jgi:hypothetical protein
LEKFDLWRCLSLQELFIFIGQLNALEKFDLWGCLNFIKITYIYWPIECTLKA